MTTEGDVVEVEGLGALRNCIVEDCTGALPTRGEAVSRTGIRKPDLVNPN